MIRPRFLILLAFVLAAAAPRARAGTDGPGTKAVHQANDTIANLLKQKVAPGSDDEKKLAAKVTTSVRDILDVDLLGERALVDHWKDIAPAKQKELLETLHGLLEDKYVEGLRANLDYTVDYTGEDKQPNGQVIVHTVVHAKRHGRPFTAKVDYVLDNVDGKLKVFDVNNDGSDLVENYREQFDKIIDKDGVDGLIAKMKKKRAQG